MTIDVRRPAMAALLTLLAAGAAHAAPTIDGVRDAQYGASKASVGYSSTAPSGNFGAPTANSNGASYDIYLTADTGYVYGYLNTTGMGTSAGSFANLYFDIDPGNGNGSDVGCEITNNRCFVAGGSGYSAVTIQQFVSSSVIEFAIPNSVFTMALPGLEAQQVGQQFATAGSDVVLRISQSFGYTAAGGDTFGNNRLGRVTLVGAPSGAVPEPASWLMMVAGFGLVGAGLRGRRTRVAFA